MMNDSTPTPNQSTAMDPSPIVCVQIPDIATSVSDENSVASEKLIQQTTSRIDSLQQTIDESNLPADTTANSNLTAPLASDLESLDYQSADIIPKKVDGLVDSILQRFPLSHSAAITFVGSKTDGETDKVTFDVARRLADRGVGKVLLVDSNPNSQSLSTSLNLNETAGLGDIVCDEQPWHDLVQAGPASGLDVLPYGNMNTAKVLRSRTAGFLEHTKEVYQFICVSVGLNESPIAKSFCNATDGIYLLIDLNQTSHTEAKTVADKFKLNNQPLIGCIALDGTQESK